jgi:hypothetical protein
VPRARQVAAWMMATTLRSLPGRCHSWSSQQQWPPLESRALPWRPQSQSTWSPSQSTRSWFRKSMSRWRSRPPPCLPSSDPSRKRQRSSRMPRRRQRWQASSQRSAPEGGPGPGFDQPVWFGWRSSWTQSRSGRLSLGLRAALPASGSDGHLARPAEPTAQERSDDHDQPGQEQSAKEERLAKRHSDHDGFAPGKVTQGQRDRACAA